MLDQIEEGIIAPIIVGKPLIAQIVPRCLHVGLSKAKAMRFLQHNQCFDRRTSFGSGRASTDGVGAATARSIGIDTATAVADKDAARTSVIDHGQVADRKNLLFIPFHQDIAGKKVCR